MSENTTAYNADSIDIFEGLTPIHKRPGMYIGGTGKYHMHHLLWEVVNNSLDEALSGFCSEVSVVINEDNSITVTDNGRGIPVDNKKESNGKTRPVVEVLMTTIHSGGKFGSGAYGFSGGLHGVGLSAVNALSDFTTVEVRRDGTVYSIGFEYREQTDERGEKKAQPGSLVHPLAKIGTCDRRETGTSVTFRPLSNGFFESNKWDIEFIKTRLKFMAYTMSSVEISFTDARAADEEGEFDSEVYFFENGIYDLVDHRAFEVAGYTDENGEDFFDVLLSDGNLAVNGPVLEKAAEDGTQKKIGSIEIVAQWTTERTASVDSIVNAVVTTNGGVHVDGVRRALVRTINRVSQEIGLTSKEEKITWEDLSHGIILVINALLEEPEFEGQTKNTLGGKESLRNAFQSAANKALSVWVMENPAEIRDIAERAVEAMSVRVQRAEEDDSRSQAQNSGAAPADKPSAKLRDCSVHGELSELIVVEGDSAGGDVDAARNTKYQALLPLRGKINNMVLEIVSIRAKRAAAIKAGKNPEEISLPKGPVTDIVASLGAGTEGQFDESKLRYGRFVMMTDADDDGRHITMLLEALLYVLMPEMIYSGRVFEVRTPLFSGRYKDEIVFAASEADRDQIVADNPKKKFDWQRFKGLGQMNRNELMYHGLNPTTRILKNIKVEEAKKAAFDVVMDAVAGSNSEIKWDILRWMSENDNSFPEWVVADALVDADDDADSDEYDELASDHTAVVG